MHILKAYRFPLTILLSVIIGAILGLVFGEKVEVIKPLGDLFLNLMFTLVVPLVFFSIASAVADTDNAKRLGKIMGSMLGVFIITGIVASLIMLLSVSLFSPTEGVSITLKAPDHVEQAKSFSDQLVQAFTVDDFSKIFSRENMLALIVFAALVGLSTSLIGEKGKPFASLLKSGSEVFIKFVSIVMYYAPIGLGAYFASLVGVFGPQLVGDYARAAVVYYPTAIIYFLVGFTLYAFLAGGPLGIKTFWKNAVSPTAVSLATSSSVATIPVNLEAAQRNGVPRDIRETIIPIGATIHMDGSCLSAILKIAFLFSIFQKDLLTPSAFLIAIGIALLSGMVMSGIPGGGFIGEMMIVTMYGFPTTALPILAILGTLVDPPATMVNAVGDNVSSMLVTRIVDGKNWLKRALSGNGSGSSVQKNESGQYSGENPHI
ncbi:Na+/H+-dicarboxylate symporter [Scopulibacillus darangshiensis]|uniref:Na+/H+-dicarboxylate symporter n=1 Tax=Scopulibacillus darangshiensis TaxID=442528 RepID=A0A4V2SN32_9BACL|nr:dicarboxylate/amino acid:cation symporter [Scopulibacillus darangshiensis]TCP29616.1 Na+/H+-dicarboxylate symporter [Scopulibacillus darangshiensis]